MQSYFHSSYRSVLKDHLNQLLMYSKPTQCHKIILTYPCSHVCRLARPMLGWAWLAALLHSANLTGLSSLLWGRLRFAPFRMSIHGANLSPGFKGRHYWAGLLLILLGVVDSPGHLLPMAMAEAIAEYRWKLWCLLRLRLRTGTYLPTFHWPKQVR